MGVCGSSGTRSDERRRCATAGIYIKRRWNVSREHRVSHDRYRSIMGLTDEQIASRFGNGLAGLKSA